MKFNLCIRQRTSRSAFINAGAAKTNQTQATSYRVFAPSFPVGNRLQQRVTDTRNYAKQHKTSPSWIGNFVDIAII